MKYEDIAFNEAYSSKTTEKKPKTNTEMKLKQHTTDTFGERWQNV